MILKSRKLKARMVQMGITQKGLAHELGISIQSLNDKLNGRGVINIYEASKITDLLKLEEPCNIFFDD